MRMTRDRDEPKSRIGRYLNALMAHHGYESNAEVERATGGTITASMISRWNSGVTAPSVASLRSLLTAFPGTRLVDLLVEAELVSTEELGMAGSATPAPAQHPLAGRLNRFLLNEAVPAARRKLVEDNVENLFSALTGELKPLPKEPSAAERAAGRTVTR